MEVKMNKEIFLRELRRFLADIPEEEREQALTYYEDYFEDAGPENEQKVIQELGSPIDVAKQIKATNQENIAYGQGNDFQKDKAYPNVYESGRQAQKESHGPQNSGNYFNNGAYSQNSGNYSNNGAYSQNSGNYGNNGAYSQNSGNYSNNGAYSQNSGNFNGTGPYQAQKKSWTQDPAKITLVVILAILAIPVGLPVISVIFALLISCIAVIFSLVIALFALGGGLAIGGVGSLIGSFFAVGGFANTLTMIGVGLILTCIGIFIFWIGILFCAKFFPAIFRAIGALCQSIAKWIRSLFS
ncbi:DUF1700 domain-containing protein [bacterium 1xD8-6]|nr:DUF1700 domain-containing protein [bacterium D16-36]RKI73005.1 DUF1700 domain-containing protein [bacterium 1xD8-6]